MVRSWYLNWTNKSSSKKKTATGDSGRRGGSGGDPRRTTIHLPEAVAAAGATGGGCMNVLLHLFDFHHLQHRFHHHTSSFRVDSSVQAPKNSLASLEEMVSLASLIKLEKHGSTHLLESRSDTKLKQVQAPRAKILDHHSTETTSTPSSARTPSLVARLMGLDNLPESNTITPRLTSRSQPLLNPHMPHRCPPESPSVRSSSSSMRRRSTDDASDLLPQRSFVKEIESSRPSCSAISTKNKKLKIYEEDGKSPRYYARQITNQVGVIDITNTIAQRNRKHNKDKHSSTLSNYRNKSTTNHDLEVITKKRSKLEEEAMLKPSNKPCLMSKDLIIFKKELIVRPPMSKKHRMMPLSRDLLLSSVLVEGSSSKVGPSKKLTCNTKQQSPRIPSQAYVEISKKPYIEAKPRIHQQPKKINNLTLPKQLCMKIMTSDGYHPNMDCQRSLDANIVDALVQELVIKDVSVLIEEQKEAIVLEIECDIVDALVQEIVMLSFGYHFCSMQRTCISRFRL